MIWSAMRLFLRSLCWATLLGAGITALIVWRTAPESGLTLHVVTTMFGVVWVLSFVPSVILELLIAHLRIELGELNAPRRRRWRRWRFRS